MAYINEHDYLVYDSCQKPKTTKVYNRNTQEQATRPYKFIYTDLVRLLLLQNFRGEQYFFMFTDNFIRYTKTFTGI